MKKYLLVLLLAGCAQQQPQVSYRDQVFAQCRSYGHVEGTEQFKQCVMQVDMQNRALINQQALQDESARQYRAMPMCSSLTAFEAGFYRAQGRCR